jgi:hypothetical protein
MRRFCLLLLLGSVAVAAALPEAGSARHAGANPATEATPKRSLLVLPGVFGKGTRRVVPTETTEMVEVRAPRAHTRRRAPKAAATRAGVVALPVL